MWKRDSEKQTLNKMKRRKKKIKEETKQQQHTMLKHNFSFTFVSSGRKALMTAYELQILYQLLYSLSNVYDFFSSCMFSSCILFFLFKFNLILFYLIKRRGLVELKINSKLFDFTLEVSFCVEYICANKISKIFWTFCEKSVNDHVK